MKKLLLLCLLALSTAIVSCTTETLETTVYTFSLAKYQLASPGELTTVTNYLNEKGCPTSGPGHILTFSSSSQADNDAQAATKFNQVISKLDYAEIKALGLDSGSSFSYTMARGKSSQEKEDKVIGTFVYPKP